MIMAGILNEIKEKYTDIYVDKSLPNAFFMGNIKCNEDIQAIVLGTDPTNNSDLSFEAAFALGPKDEEVVTKYFKVRNKKKNRFYSEDGDYKGYLGNAYNNIIELGLNKTNLYIQNLCKNYTYKETSKYFSKLSGIKKIKTIEKKKQRIISEIQNNRWVQIAEEWVPELKSELDEFDPGRDIPVLITTEYLLFPLIKIENVEDIKVPMDYYNNNLVIARDRNNLGRTLVPFFRHHNYKLCNQPEYKEFIKSEILHR